MEDLCWCRSCYSSVSLAHALASLPCPRCGASDYLIITDDPDRDILLSTFDRMQRVARWDEAEAAIRRCLDYDYISQADYNLSMASLVCRRECAASAAACIKESGGRCLVTDLRNALARDYDSFTINWLLQEYSGIRLVSSGRRFYAEVNSDAP